MTLGGVLDTLEAVYGLPAPPPTGDPFELIVWETVAYLAAHLGRLPLAQARRAMRRFPGLGEPGADKILLLARLHPVLAFDSNGLRALVRLGYGTETRTYAATYRSALAAVQAELPRDASFDWLIRAHLLLRQHGQHVCRRSRPACERCPLGDTCAYAHARAAR